MNLRLKMKSGIKRTLLLWFLGLSLIPLLLLALIEHNFSRDLIQAEVINNLVSVTNNKAIAMRHYVKERKKAISTLAKTPSVAVAIESLQALYLKGVDSPRYLEREGKFREFASYYKEQARYYDLFLISPSGDVIFTVVHEDDFGTNLLTGPYRESELARVFSRAHTMLDTGVSDFRYYPPSDEPAMFIAAPVFRQNKFVGVVALQMDASELMGIVTEYIGLGKTGETVIGSLRGNRVELLGPLRHKKSGYKNQVTLGSEEALPIQEAVRGKSGDGFSIDYRGKKVLAAWRYEPYLRWGMVVKIDKEEAFVEISNLERRMVFALLVTSALVFGVALFLSQAISLPIYKLTTAAKKIIGGNFALKISPDIKSLDNEIGELALSFEGMAKHLIDANIVLDEKVRERTRELEEAMDKLKGSSQLIQAEKMSALGMMVAGVAHELNNPMMGILNYIQYCRRGVSPDDKRYQVFEDAESEIYRCIKIVKNLLSFSRLEAEGAESFRNTDMGEVIRSVLALLAYRIELENIELIIDIGEGTPMIQVKQTTIQQVILNLISNAMDAVEGASKKEISIKLSSDETTFFLTITDTGCGVGDEELKKVFLPFFTTKTVGRGTGLGLSVCDSIIRDHGGEISVISRKGEGSTFTVKLNLGERGGRAD